MILPSQLLLQYKLSWQDIIAHKMTKCFFCNHRHWTLAFFRVWNCTWNVPVTQIVRQKETIFGIALLPFQINLGLRTTYLSLLGDIFLITVIKSFEKKEGVTSSSKHKKSVGRRRRGTEINFLSTQSWPAWKMKSYARQRQFCTHIQRTKVGKDAKATHR